MTTSRNVQIARAVTVLLLMMSGIGFAQTDPSAVKPTHKTTRPILKTRIRVRKTTARPVRRAMMYSRRRAAIRRVRLARAHARARWMAEAAVARRRPDRDGTVVPDIRAAAWVIYDPLSARVIVQENAGAQRSIASITKVMTALVFLSGHPDLSQTVRIQPSDVYRASTTYLRARDLVSVDDLLHLLLIPSDNAAARALARISPEGSAGFVDAMNRKAAELRLTNTHYADPSGLDARNVSSAYDMARLITYASKNDEIASVMRLPMYTVHPGNRVVTVRSTDHLLGRKGVDVRAAKTGFITKAGFCLATLLRLPRTGRDVAVVVLGARSNAGRFADAQDLFTWLSTRATGVFGTVVPSHP